MKGYDSRPTKPRRERDPNAMEVDALKTDRLSKEEREKLSKEGRCFQCKKQGHMSRDCPDKKKSDKEPKKNDKDKGATKVRTAVINEDEEEEDNMTKVGSEKGSRCPTPDVDDVVKYVCHLKAEGRDNLMEILACEGF